MILEILRYIAMFLSICGNYFVNRKNVLGMWIWSIGSLLWFVLAIISHDYSQVIMFSIYTYFNIDGILKWSKQNENIKINKEENN